MPENIIFCPRCDSNRVVKNGFTHNGNQNFKCKDYGKQFVLDPKSKIIVQETFRLNRQAAGETTTGWYC